MRPEKAFEIAANLYHGHPAAPTLVLEAVHGLTQERRLRSAMALRCLDPDEPLPISEVEAGPAWTAALSIATLLVGNVSGTRHDRQRVAGLLRALCVEASRIHESERAA
jgi:hypothetical protein